MQKEYKEQAKVAKNKRIWELWKEDLNDVNVKDIAVKLNKEMESRKQFESYEKVFKSMQKESQLTASGKLNTIDDL